MKVLLMHRDHDFDFQQDLPAHTQALTQDLELKTLVKAMALGDNLVLDVVRTALFEGLNSDLDTIRYRQGVLMDCLKNASVVRDIYQITIELIENKRQHWFFGMFGRYPGAILSSAREMLHMFVGLLKQLKTIADAHADQFESEGFARFFKMIQSELEDDYFSAVQRHLRELRFRDGVPISAELGRGNEGTHYILRKSQEKEHNLIKRIRAKKSPVYTYSLSPRDDAGARALGELRDRGLNVVANALAQSADHIDGFFKMLRVELAFYIGCLNLYEKLVELGEPAAFPEPEASGKRRCSFHELYDVCLALTMNQKIVGNEVSADNKDLVFVTGANQGGKSTFLRSIGVAQLMMQCGMFVPAASFRANLCDGLFTHYKREEDASMQSGKLDEELSRMSDIVDRLKPNALVLFNESFAATNEREGSEIARQITCALVEKRIKVFFVTHLYEFPRWFHDPCKKNVLFLRAERRAGGKRTFKLIEGAPRQTSYGEDLYNRIFGAAN
jgi:DNA mismatch repair ATPase MutS